MDIGTVLRGLYASEINASVSWFWDGCFDWSLGDGKNGVLFHGTCETIEDVATALHKAALKHYPGSVYARSPVAPTAPVLTEEMMEAVKNAIDFLEQSDDKYDGSGPFWGDNLRVAFGLEEVPRG